MLAAVAMCIQFRSYLRGARFTLRTDHIKSLVWLHRFKDTEGMMSRWLHALQQFQFSIVHRPGKDHGNADGLSRAPSLRPHHVDSAPAPTAHRPSYYMTIRTNHSTPSYHASLFGGHLGRTRTLARLSHRFYWSSQCVACVKRKSPVGRNHPLGNIPTGHRWDRIAMDILDVCDPTPEGFRYILVIADYFSKWTEAFPMKNKCADTVADLLVDNIILRFGMPLVIHSDQGREFENGLMKSLCTLLGCTKTRIAPYHPESDGMIERFNRTCLMMMSMFVNDRRDNWNEQLPFVMHAYRTSVHESTGYSPFRLMMGEECSLPKDVSTAELQTKHENDIAPHPFATWVRDALEVAYDHVRDSLQETAAHRKPMTTFGIPFRKQQPTGNDYMTPRQLIGSFRLGRGYYVITHRPLILCPESRDL